MRIFKRYTEITSRSGTSFRFGKTEACDFIKQTCPDKESRILDVGPGRGVYNKMLKEKGYKNIDAVEVYLPYIEAFGLRDLYSEVFYGNIVDFDYSHYDVIVMGDVLEHLNVGDAQRVVAKAQRLSNLIVVAVPYLLTQIGSQVDGSGDHRQPDLTRETFLNRYEGFELLVDNEQMGVFYSKNA